MSEPTTEATAAAPEQPVEPVHHGQLGDPTVIVDDLHVVYRVLVASSVGQEVRPSKVQRILQRGMPRRVREVHALRGVSLIARRGEAIGLIGRNGSGKSTMLRAIAGLMTPTRGAVYAEGEPARLGVNAALINDLSGGQNVTLGGLALGLSPAEIRARAKDIIDFAGIEEFIDLPMRTYSSGMSARLRFAIAASSVPDVLLIDEALATGDAEFRQKSEARILEMRRQAGTVFLVSHSLGVVENTCDRVIWLDKGKIVADGETREVIAAYTKATGG